MDGQLDEKSNQTQPQSRYAIELAGLRNHFSHSNYASAGVSPFPVEDTLNDRRSPLPLDDAFVQQTKEQIRQIVDSIAKLSNSPIEPTSFVQSALAKIVHAMGAKSSMLWQKVSESDWQLLGHCSVPENLVQVRSKESAFAQLDFIEAQLRAAASDNPDAPLEETKQPDAPTEDLKRLLNAVARERQPILVPPKQVALQSDRPENPTDDIIMFAPLTLPQEQGEYWLQVHQTAIGGPSSQRGYLRFVAQMADLLSDYFKSHRLKLLERDRNYLSLAERTLHDLSSASSQPKGLARLLASIRQHANSEHAFLLRKPGKLARWRVVAAAGLTEIDRKATGIEQVELAAPILQRMVPTGGIYRTIGNRTDTAHSDLLGFANLFASEEIAWIKCDETGEDLRNSQKHDVALLLVWSCEHQHPVNCMRQCSLLARLGLTALQVPWWRKVRQMHTYKKSPYSLLSVFRWSAQLKWVVALVMLACVLALPVPIHIHAPAVLIPTVQQHVYAPWEAFVEEILVDHGQEVKQGQPLLRLKSPSLLAEYEAAESSRARNAQRLSDITDKLLRDTNLSKSQRDELEGEQISLTNIQEIEERSLRRLKRQLESLTVIAQFDGTVATWNVHNNLKDRPVRAGQWLLSLHEVETQWMFEAALPEQYASEFRAAIENGASISFATMTSAPTNPIRIRYNPTEIPYIDVSNPYFASGYTTRFFADVSVLRLRFDVEDGTIPDAVATAGATARVSITSGKGPLIWAFSKDFLRKTWSQLRLWI